MESEPPYQYVGGNVVNLTDPSGMQSGTSYPVIPVDCVYVAAGDIRPIHCFEYPPVPEECVQFNNYDDLLPVRCYPPEFPYILPFLPSPTFGSSYSPGELASTIAVEASRYGLPWQVLTSILEAEVLLDTEARDTFENFWYRYIAVIPNLDKPEPKRADLCLKTNRCKIAFKMQSEAKAR